MSNQSEAIMTTKSNTSHAKTRWALLLFSAAFCTALVVSVVAFVAPAGAQTDTGVRYTCPEGSTGNPSEAFPFCSVLSEEPVTPIVTRTYACPDGTEPAGGTGSSLICKETGALGTPGNLYVLVDPIVEVFYTCPPGSTGNPSDFLRICIRSGLPPRTVKAIVHEVDVCPLGSTPVPRMLSPFTSNAVGRSGECRKSIEDTRPDVTTRVTCPPGSEGEELIIGPDDGIAETTGPMCTRITAVLVPAIETLVPLCNGLAASIVGTEGDDELIGTDEADVIVGLGGNDRIWGLDGNDTICAGDGADSVYGGNGRDYVDGGAGRDKIRGGRQADTLHGGANGDKLWGHTGDDVLYGGQGNDRLLGNAGDDDLTGDRGRVDVLDGRSGTDTCTDNQAGTIELDCEKQ